MKSTVLNCVCFVIEVKVWRTVEVLFRAKEVCKLRLENDPLRII